MNERKPFLSLPWTRLWWDVRDRLKATSGIDIVEFSCDQVWEASILFTYKNHSFEVNDFTPNWGEYRRYNFFALDSECPTELKDEIAAAMKDFLPPQSSWREERLARYSGSKLKPGYGLLVVGPYNTLSSAGSLPYDDGYYFRMQDNPLIIGAVLVTYDSAASIKLAKALGIQIWDFNVHDLDITKINFPELEKVLNEHPEDWKADWMVEVEKFKKLCNEGCKFHFREFVP